MNLRIPLLTLAVGLAAAASAGEVKDFATAKERSRASNKPILVDFSSPT